MFFKMYFNFMYLSKDIFKNLRFFNLIYPYNYIRKKLVKKIILLIKFSKSYCNFIIYIKLIFVIFKYKIKFLFLRKF